MKYIDIDSWNRKQHFNYFKQLDYPHFNVCANVDITKFMAHVKNSKVPFFVSMVYAASKAANSIKEFRYRIKEDMVVEYETVSPSFTVMGDNEVFNFCTSEFIYDFNTFKGNTLGDIEKAKMNIQIEDAVERDDLLYITSLPWISFTSITHPINIKPGDSIPRISWGKYFEENGKIKLPYSVQAHHALMDGVHIGTYFEVLQKILDNFI